MHRDYRSVLRTESVANDRFRLGRRAIYQLGICGYPRWHRHHGFVPALRAYFLGAKGSRSLQARRAETISAGGEAPRIRLSAAEKARGLCDK
ncbi:hypothetical protein FF011L_17610 [Roseimaritima multifibrata]|uniref:Uncharacterized protein n=1 Tax=Roseimaritima multifibrata TaxID=1930274 RepID=A0A517MDU9_9BACT|nr:hypothetical protein FF011L_17610 [Roseimaritima multifibrata]